jgi:chloramphenicol 3-O-phosphotransferase
VYPDTCTKIRMELHDCANKPDSPKMCWLSGMAGTGKTTIACSICDELDKAYQLGANFFCSRLLPDCRDVTRVVPTIAYQLASFSYPFRSALCDVLSSDRDLSTYNMDTQFDKLIRE